MRRIFDPLAVLAGLAFSAATLAGNMWREIVGLADVGTQAGTYALVCRSSCQAEMAVGRLGVLRVRKGFYVYVGSAFGPGGVRARITHHVKHGLSRHWHVDYLWPVLRIAEIWYSHDPVRHEHDWVRILRDTNGSSVPLPRFGASDCRCQAHLLFFQQIPSLAFFRVQVRDSIRSRHKVTCVTNGWSQVQRGEHDEQRTGGT